MLLCHCGSQHWLGLGGFLFVLIYKLGPQYLKILILETSGASEGSLGDSDVSQG